MADEIKILRSIEVVKIDSVFPYPENPREMEEGQFEKLKESIKQHGMIDPLIVNRRNHADFKPEEKKPTVLGGNMRWRACKDLKLPEIPIAWIDVDRNREKIINIALNRISGKWDIEKLEKMVYELTEKDLKIDLSVTGLEDWEIKLYNPAEDIDAESIEKIVGGDDKPTFVLKIVFSNADEFERASKVLGGDNRVRNIIRGEQLNKVLDVYEKQTKV